MSAPDTQLSDAQSRQIAATIREELARRRISRQQLADQAKLSISTLEKALGGRRPFTLATTVRLEQALGVPLRKSAEEPAPAAPPPNGEVAPESLGAYSRRAVTWMEGTYVTVRPSFSEPGAIYAYRTEIAWDAAASCLIFREGERIDAAFAQRRLKPNIALEAIDSDVIKTYVKSGLGVGIVAELAVRDDPPGGELVHRPAGHLFGRNVTRVAFRRGAYLRGYVLTFAELLSDRLTRPLLLRALGGDGETYDL